MTLVARRKPLDNERFFSDFFAPLNRQLHTGENFFAPRVDIHEFDDRYEISAELAGVSKEDIQITLLEGVLKIEAETRSENREENTGKRIRSERHYGKYQRSFKLGDQIHEEDIQASFNNGVLLLVATKRAPEQPQQRHITIQ